MNHTKILFVDDDPNVLSGYQRQLRKHFAVGIATGGTEALAMIPKSGPYAVIVSDMRMPGMSGTDFLSNVSVLAPDTVRIMLTGNADQQTAVTAINEGRIFRFLNKPCSVEAMLQVLEAGIAQYRLVTAEKELLEKTLLGSIGVFIEVLSTTDPATFKHVKGLRDLVREVAYLVADHNSWELEVAALLSRIGHLTLAPAILLKTRGGLALTDQELELLAQIPEIGSNLLVKIPRLETVAQIVRYSTKLYNGAGRPVNGLAGEQIPQGARFLKILSDLMEIEAKGTPRSVALRKMHNHNAWYDPSLLGAISAHFIPPLPTLMPEIEADPNRGRRTLHQEAASMKEDNSPEEPSCLEIGFDKLLVGDELVMDIKSIDGSLLLAVGSPITEPVLETLKSYVQMKGVQEPILVAVSAEEA